jgi:predicted amidohydrolase
MPEEFIDVALIAMYGKTWALEENYQRMERYVREAAANGAQLVIAPETVLDGYICGKCEKDPSVTKEDMLAVAQSIPDGPYLKRAAELCRELSIYLVFGFLRKEGTDLFNTVALFDPQGTIIASHSKVNSDSEMFIVPGRELKPVDTPLGRVGFLICMDRTVPDNFLTLGAQDVELIIIPMDGSGGPENTKTMSQRARDCFSYVLVANTWSSVMVEPDGSIAIERYETGCVSMQRLHYSRIPKGNDRWHYVRRRPDLYGPLVGPADELNHYDENGYPSAELESIRTRAREGGTT